MLVLDGEKNPYAEPVQRIIEDAAATNARLHMQRDTEKTTPQNKEVRGIVGLVIKPYHASHFKVLSYVACPLTSLLN